MPRIPKHQEDWEPEDEKDEVLDILANPFEPGDTAFTAITMRVKVLDYYKDGFYSVEFENGLWSDNDELVLIHYSDLTAVRPPSPEDGRRPA
jgi:hypothetical protein